MSANPESDAEKPRNISRSGCRVFVPVPDANGDWDLANANKIAEAIWKVTTDRTPQGQRIANVYIKNGAVGFPLHGLNVDDTQPFRAQQHPVNLPFGGEPIRIGNAPTQMQPAAFVDVNGQ